MDFTGARLREEARKIEAEALGGPSYDWQAAAPPKLFSLAEAQRQRLPRPRFGAIVIRTARDEADALERRLLGTVVG